MGVDTGPEIYRKLGTLPIFQFSSKKMKMILVSDIYHNRYIVSES